ncbi:MAG: molybdopterin-dependent oxidoreductase [Pseudonocardiales bacterium]|nr:molybdopterin-dependent oxidoreductase [Pseudonocardiales bacterium]MBV9031739.1 molybdopterin-dependent oxidoreductase [Pseudonocardiales bacterium]
MTNPDRGVGCVSRAATAGTTRLIRTGFGTNNVDHCTRLCHASSVAALFEGIGSGAVSTTYGDVLNADVAIITGSDATANHPVAGSFFKQARRRGTTIIYIDPRADRGAAQISGIDAETWRQRPALCSELLVSRIHGAVL